MTEINDKIRKFLTRFFRKAEVGDQEDIFALGFVNSLFAMQLVMFLETEFSITVATQDLDLDISAPLRKLLSLLRKNRHSARKLGVQTV
jgi:methoxymalonate biosynthesis acyl carrier protein